MQTCGYIGDTASGAYGDLEFTFFLRSTSPHLLAVAAMNRLLLIQYPSTNIVLRVPLDQPVNRCF